MINMSYFTFWEDLLAWLYQVEVINAGCSPGQKPSHSATDAGGLLDSKKAETSLNGETPSHRKTF